MPASDQPRTSPVNGRLWGARANDWANLQEPIFRPVYDTVFDRCGVAKATRYLDVGCGAGLAAAIASQRGAKVSGVDAAVDLLAIARARLASGDFRIADLQDLPFADAAFDVITGFNAFQYAASPVAAVVEARRACQPGGWIAIVTWGDPATMEAASLVTALRPLLPPPPPGAPGPFALSEAAALRKLATDAGLTPVEVFDVDCPFHYLDLNAAIGALNASGVAARAMETSGEAAVTEAHKQALAPFRRDDGGYLARASFRCLTAKA